MNPPFALLDSPPGPVLVISCSPVAQLTPIIATDMGSPAAPAPLAVDPMEALWHAHFDHLFSNFWPCAWQLIPKPLVNCPVTNWNIHSDSAKVRFLCQTCGHGWTSMKGRVVFWYNFDPRNLCGTVAFALFGQKCQQCSRDGFDNFTSAMWYQEEVVKVLFNVYNSVGQIYYGFQQPSFLKLRRPGKPRSQHAAELCQACQMGVCSAAKKEAIVEANPCSKQHPVNACAIVQANRGVMMVESGVA